MTLPGGSHTFTATKTDAGLRLDLVVCTHLVKWSRSRAAGLIRSGSVTVNEIPRKPGYSVRGGDIICCRFPKPTRLPFEPQPIPIDIIHQDRDLVVINKPPGLVVHPAPGHYTGTLVNALLYWFPDIMDINRDLRPGIVHRLDKDTSGVMVVAKTETTLTDLAAQFKERTIKKRYLALVYGAMAQPQGNIDLPIGRHPVHRKKMSVRSRTPRWAATAWRLKAAYEKYSLLTVDLQTGRTHQIRVHLAAIGHPVVGDSVYGGRRVRRDSTDPALAPVDRQMLHAWQLAFDHPCQGIRVEFEAPLAPDMSSVLNNLASIQGTTD